MPEKISARDKGFTLIEIMIVLSIIAILAAIAIPNFLGVQEKAKRKVIMKMATSSKSELHSWLGAALKKEKGVVDVNGSGFIEPLEVHTTLLTVPNSWIQAFAAKVGYTPLSPWYGAKSLFTVGPLNPAAYQGQVVFSRFNNGRGIQILAYGKNGVTLYHETVSID